MRLLPVGPDHVRFGAAREQSTSDGCRYRQRDVRQHLPLRDLCAHSRGDQAGRAIERTGRLSNDPRSNRPAERNPCSVTIRKGPVPAHVSAGRCGRRRGPHTEPKLAVRSSEAEANDAERFAPNAFIRVEGDGQIVLTMPYVGMGQGTYTAIPMLIAEELEVDLKQVRLEHAPPNEKLYANPLVGIAGNGRLHPRTRGSGSRCVKPARSQGPCSCRRLAKRWNVDPASCRAQSGEGTHLADWQKAQSMANSPPMPPACLSPNTCGAEAPGRLQAHRLARRSVWTRRRRGHRNSRLWYRRAAARREDRDACSNRLSSAAG